MITVITNYAKDYKPYCPKFNDAVKEKVRERFGRKCYLCPKKETKEKLHIHHVDYNKNTLCNGKEWPLIPLCRSCHTRTNSYRWYWYNLLINYWIYLYDFNRYWGFDNKNFDSLLL
jgi:hypothetical protein